jgi:hypothetical protein
VADLAEPTRDDLKNGWTRESLNAYLAERAQQKEAFAAELAESKIKKAKSENVTKFDPHKWGG